MRDRALTFVLAVLLSSAVHAQVVWQPTPAPLVTAENTSWFRAGDPIDWNGDLYYPAGVPEFFNRYQMVRSGSYRGIPLYTDVTLVPNSIVFVPLAGERMQPYERPRTGQLAGTSGSRVSNLPSDIGAQGSLPNGIQQAAMPPTVGQAYDGALPAPELVAFPVPREFPPNRSATTDAAPVARPSAVGTSGRSVVPSPTATITSVVPPTGLNGIWISYDGQRWFAKGNAVELSSAPLREVGSYHGFAVYQRAGDDSTIYVPTTPGRVAPYVRR
jgi:hypothetical protein